MIRTIALLRWLANKLQALVERLDDLRERTTGLALTATTEKLVATRQKLDQTFIDQTARHGAALRQREEDNLLAEARYQDTLTRIRTTADRKCAIAAGKCEALEAKRKALRAELTTG